MLTQTNKDPNTDSYTIPPTLPHQAFLSFSEYWNILTVVMLNKLRSHTHFLLSANQITWSRLLIQIHILTDKQCRSKSVGFWRSSWQLIWIYTVCKGRAYPGSAGPGWTPHHICPYILSTPSGYFLMCLKTAGSVANSADPDQMPHSAEHIWVYTVFSGISISTLNPFKPSGP